MTAYYNEIDPYAAQWLRNLIAAGHIAPGIVDTRSIEDVRPEQLTQFTQCHFFAGIGVWSYALRQAGWPDDRPVWTGSCPCQPFSAAGKGAGFADERHLWPAFHWLIEQRRPAVVFGEQVASKDGLAWLDLVQADLEGTGYASRAVDLCAAGVGAPHIRQRLWWVAERLADTDHRSEHALLRGEPDDPIKDFRRRPADGLDGRLAGGYEGEFGRLADAALGDQRRFGGIPRSEAGSGSGEARPADGDTYRGAGSLVHNGQPGPTNGLWRAADWLLCRDGKWRPVEPGTFPLAHGAPARVGRLRAYGNAINAVAAQAFVEAVMAS